MLLLDVHFNATFCYTVALYLQHSKKLTDQITIICLVCILVLNDLNALLTDSQNTKVFTTTESATLSAFLNLQHKVNIMLMN